MMDKNMKILSGKEAEEALKWFDKTVDVAQRSLCLRARCGSIIVKNDKIIGQGYNAPPQDNPAYRTCLDEYDIPDGFRHDRTCCVHAEQRAIADAIKKENNMSGARIYFINIDENIKKLPAKDLKCTICSRAVLDAGISEFALYRDDGVHVYDTVEFNELSYKYKTNKIN